MNVGRQTRGTLPMVDPTYHTSRFLVRPSRRILRVQSHIGQTEKTSVPAHVFRFTQQGHCWARLYRQMSEGVDRFRSLRLRRENDYVAAQEQRANQAI
jgi:hypothetical protein